MKYIVITIMCVLGMAASAADVNVYLDSGSSEMSVNDASSNSLLRVKSNGNVGVGKDPGVAMDINGICQASNFVGNGAGLFNISLKQFNNVIFVATNGTPAGPGTIAKPFNSVQAGYDAAAALTNPAAVVVASGSYTGLIGTLNMHAGDVHVLGFSRPQLWSLAVNAPATNILGKQRVENIVVYDVTVAGDGVKFHNCRIQEGMTVSANDVEVQDCYVTGGPFPMKNAVYIAPGCTRVALYNSSIENGGLVEPPTGSTILIDDGVNDLLIKGCHVINDFKLDAASHAIEDRQTTSLASTNLHLITHNYIKRAGVDVPGKAVATVAGNVVGVFQNTVYGDLGTNNSSRAQLYTENVVFGVINWPQSTQWGGTDSYGNSRYGQFPAKLPDPWDD